MRKGVKKAAVFTLGWILIVVGVSGLILPILPGIIIIFIGVYILSLESEWTRNKLESFFKRYPWFKKEISFLEHRLTSIFKNKK
jgi:uncharacterized membrane protein YbaN (DUF454 family)